MKKRKIPQAVTILAAMVIGILVGWRMLARMSPSSSEISEAVMNQPMAFANTRPTEAASPMCATPTTSVEKTRGPISILISRRNTSDMIET